MAVTFNRKANTITMAVGDTYTVPTNEAICIEQIIWYAFTAATDNFLLNINGETYLPFQAGATSGAIRIPAHHKWLKAGDTLNLQTMDHGSILIQLVDF